MSDENTKSYPASWVAHWPTGPVHCCDVHAKALKGLGGFMGTHVHLEPYEGDEECTNCVNENSGK